MTKNLILIGHRGAAGYVPENTPASFEKAIELGVDMVELDVRLCKSGELVLMHDDTVDRTTDGSGYVADKTLDELKKLKINDGQQVATLEEVFDLINQRVKINIELKGHNTAEPTAQLIKQYVEEKGWSYDDFLVSSFDHVEVQKFRDICPEVTTGAIVVALLSDLAAFTERVPVNIAMISKDYVNKEFVQDAHIRGKKVFVYTVNHLDQFKHIKNLGVDGIYTDYPADIK